MPELPEVEVVTRSLKKSIKNSKIIKITVNNRNLRFKLPKNFEHVLKTFRNRCRPKFTGKFDGYDCALMQKFADAFDIDDSSNSQ